MTYRRAFATPRDGVMKDGTIRYRASKFDCDACALKSQCCPNMPARKIATGLIYFDDEANELHELLGTTARPLNELSERELCPGSKALEAINASLR